jgi:hypothetical protein
MVDRASPARKGFQPVLCDTGDAMDLRALRPTDAAVTRDIDLRRWRASFEGVPAIADLADRQPGVCVGVVAAIRLIPRRAIEVTVEDGSGRLIAAFPGRTALRGLELGGGLRLEGTVTVDGDGLRRMRSPAATPVREPYA